MIQFVRDFLTRLYEADRATVTHMYELGEIGVAEYDQLLAALDESYAAKLAQLASA